MTTQRDIDLEAMAIVDRKMADGQRVTATWIVHEVIANHPMIEGDDTDFYRLCAYGHVRDSVRRAISRFQISAELDQRQLVLPGCKRVQCAYLVERDGEQEPVPTDTLSMDEMMAKVNELRAMGAGCYEHADELLRYWMQKHQAANQTA